MSLTPILLLSGSNEKPFGLYTIINPYVTNGISHPYHLDESTFIFTSIGSIFISFYLMKTFDENHISKQNSPVLRCHIWGFSVCLRPIKGRQAYMGLRTRSDRILIIVVAKMHYRTYIIKVL